MKKSKKSKARRPKAKRAKSAGRKADNRKSTTPKRKGRKVRVGSASKVRNKRPVAAKRAITKTKKSSRGGSAPVKSASRGSKARSGKTARSAPRAGPLSSAPPRSLSSGNGEAAAKTRVARYIPGPTYTEMQQPWKLPAVVRDRAAAALHAREFDPANLFNIHWYGWTDGKPVLQSVVLPPELTGVRCNIVVLMGSGFPSGSHKVGPAYSILAEAEVDGLIQPGTRMIGPSTGNFGIGVAYISRLKGYPATVVMPDNMSDERYERIRHYGGELELTPGTESDVILVLERVQEIKHRPNQYVLAQFEMMPNYRFHRHVTGAAAIEAVKDVGDGRIAAFVSAPGSAGTIAAGDHIKTLFPDCTTVALEPRQCSTLFDGGQGQHRIEGIGDKMVVLIHNVLTTDYIALIDDEDCVRGLKVFEEGAMLLQSRCGLDARLASVLPRRFGISSLCNLIGAIKTARRLDLPAHANVVTIATDGFDRYPSVMVDLAQRVDEAIDARRLEAWFEKIFLGATADEFLDVRAPEQKDRLHRDKRWMWMRFGYTSELLDAMEHQDHWEREYEKVFAYDQKITRYREEHGGLTVR